MKIREVLGVHGVVLEVEDPDSESRRWRHALGLSVLRRRRREIVLGGPAFFVVLRRAPGRSAVAELHLAVKELSGASRAIDPLGGRHAAVALGHDLKGLRLIVRQLVAPPSPTWRPKARPKGRK
ncbi:MAG TPA: hypothetical protein VH854_17750 [Thermoanaerobaculia bacterium]|jgi:hypothetical protein|nr:hypothetical protein [Thermoanaerobaculia bacterium]